MTTVGPLDLAPDAPQYDDLRSQVTRHRDLVRAAFLYLRLGDTEDEGARIMIGLDLEPKLREVDEDELHRAARDASAAVGPMWGQAASVETLGPELLDGVLQVAPPIGAGGDLEDAIAEPGLTDTVRTARVAALLVDRTVVVPTATQLDERARLLESGDELELPRLTIEDRRAVPCFTSTLALAHTQPPWPGAISVTGAQLVQLAGGDDLIIDPGLIRPCFVPGPMLEILAEER